MSNGGHVLGKKKKRGTGGVSNPRGKRINIHNY